MAERRSDRGSVAGCWRRRLGRRGQRPVYSLRAGPERFEDVVALAWGDEEANRTAQAIAGHVDLGGRSASGTPRPGYGPPSARSPGRSSPAGEPAPGVEVSIRWLSLSPDEVGEHLLPHPRRRPAAKRLCAVFHLPCPLRKVLPSARGPRAARRSRAAGCRTPCAPGPGSTCPAIVEQSETIAPRSARSASHPWQPPQR